MSLPLFRHRENESGFPNLKHLMGAYFHQDYDIMGDSEQDILREFAQCRSPKDLTGTIAELDVFLSLPEAGLLNRYAKETGEWDMPIGDDDASARRWLEEARRIMMSVGKAR